MVSKPLKMEPGGSESLWELLGDHLGAKMAPEIAKRRPRKPLGGVWEHLGAKMAPKIAPRGAKIVNLVPRWRPRGGQMQPRWKSWLHFDRFLLSGCISKSIDKF